MSDQGLDFQEVLREAQALGYAEADPSFDVDGIDAAQKIALLASLAFGSWVPYEAIYTEGISRLSQADIAYARELGYRVKLLALAKMAEGRLDVRVHPALVAAESWLANVNGVYNAISIRGDVVGRNMLIGRGAGALPTGSAVVGDIVDVARNILKDSSGRVPPQSYQAHSLQEVPLQEIDDVVCKYYLRFQVRGSAAGLGDHCRHPGRACHQHRIGASERAWACPGRAGVGGDDDPRGAQSAVSARRCRPLRPCLWCRERRCACGLKSRRMSSQRMGVVVQKYGGTSVGSIERIRAVAERVQRARQEGHQVVVVVSAMAGETDRLLRLAREVSATPEAREVDTLLATGEMVSIALVAMALHEVGCAAESFTGRRAGF